MPVKLPLAANSNNLQDLDVLFSDTIYNVTLSTTTNTTLTVPSSSDLGGANTSSSNYLVARIRHTPGQDVWFANNATAAAPAGNTFALASSELLDNNVCEYKVTSGDVLNFYTAGTSVHVSVAFYWL